MTESPRTTTSPVAPPGRSLPSPSTTRTSTSVCATPTDSMRSAQRGCWSSASCARDSAVIVIGDSPWP
jgi:hypothetical protein